MKQRLALLEKQYRGWSLGNSTNVKKKPIKKSPEPFITISRDFSGGKGLIAKTVAKELGFRVFDKELIEMIASSAQVKNLLVESLDQRHLGQVEEFFENLFNIEHVNETTYMKHLSRVILSLITKGKAIIVGRGANFIAPFSWGLQVRIISPLQERMERLTSVSKISVIQAKKLVLKEDNKRALFIRKNFGRDINDPLAYDLVINAGEFDVPQITNIIVRAFKEKIKRTE